MFESFLNYNLLLLAHARTYKHSDKRTHLKLNNRPRFLPVHLRTVTLKSHLGLPSGQLRGQRSWLPPQHRVQAVGDARQPTRYDADALPGPVRPGRRAGDSGLYRDFG